MLSKLFFYYYWFYKHHWLASFYLSVRQIWVSSTSAYMFLASVCSVSWTWLIHICQINPHAAGWKTAKHDKRMNYRCCSGSCFVCRVGSRTSVWGRRWRHATWSCYVFTPAPQVGRRIGQIRMMNGPEEDVTEGTSCIFSASILEFQEVHSTPPPPPINMENHHGLNCPSSFPVSRCTLVNPGFATPWVGKKPELICCTELPGWISITSLDNFPIHPLPDKSHYPCVILEAQ